MKATSDLKNDHITVRRLGTIVQNCSDKLYLNQDIPIEDIELISVIIEEFVDRFHHGKEEQAYFPETKDKDSFGEDIRKFLIEHELGRRIARMLRGHLNSWKKGIDSREPVARFLKSYAIFISDHTGKEDKFFDMVEEKKSITEQEDQMLIKHYDSCRNQVGGKVRMEQMLKLIGYLETKEWMK
ncbi:MAG TPA: hemerythrin domain-containing protein [Nitrososphaeraceae archaeon]|nr:hemerythrin domain-containing protein [Nitrososphaeraceae archaeon]HXV89651.1 hemerythrin domain-containing protein [Nitrososphaeraceae archaeon]